MHADSWTEELLAQGLQRYSVSAVGFTTEVEACSVYDALDVARSWFYERGVRDSEVAAGEVVAL